MVTIPHFEAYKPGFESYFFHFLVMYVKKLLIPTL